MLDGSSLAGRESGLSPYPDRAQPMLRLVGGALRLAAPATPVPDDWLAAMTALLEWLDLGIEHEAQRPAQGLREMVDRARGEPPAAAAPQFAPWQAWSPVAFQHSPLHTPPGSAWVRSYLFDHGVGRSRPGARFDALLMSPHPAACLRAEAGEPLLPRPALLERMIGAARVEGRRQVAMVVQAGNRNAVVRQLLRTDRSLTRDGIDIEIVTIEDALVQLLRNPGRWDAIIAMPELRSMILALLAEAGEMPGPCPMLWHGSGQGNGLNTITAELLASHPAPLPLNAPLLIQSLLLAMLDAGLVQVAQRLYQAAAQLSQRGVVTPGRHTIAPYVTEVADAEFIALVCKGAAASGRSVADWRALAPFAAPERTSKPFRLRVVDGD